MKFVGYTSKPEIYFKNASLHIFPSISESFGLVVAETKIFGIPNIVVGVDYTSTVQGGTIIIYDEKPLTIAKEAIKILTNKNYRKKLGREARKSMKKFNNHFLNNRWIKLFISVYKGDNYYNQLRQEDKKISNIIAMKILNNQIKLLKKRNKLFNKLNIKNFLNFSYMNNLKKNLK